MNNTASKMNEKIKKLCLVAMFTALAYICVLIAPIKVGFLTFDTKDAVMCIGAMIFGPVSGVVMSFVTALVEMISVSSTGPWGALMNFIQSTVFAVVASLIYKYRRNMTGAIIGLCSTVVATTAVMMVANLLITPLYMGVSTQDVAALIPTMLLPFNATKSVLNASLVLLLYKPVTTALRSAKLLPKAEGSKGFSGKNAVVVTVVALILIAVCVSIFVVVMKGQVF